MIDKMDVVGFLHQELNEKAFVDSCFAGTVGITYKDGEIQQGAAFGIDEMYAFAEAYAKEKLKSAIKPLKWRMVRGCIVSATAIGDVEVRQRAFNYGLDIPFRDLEFFDSQKEAMQRAYELHCEALKGFYND